MRVDHATWMEFYADHDDAPDFTGRCEGTGRRKCGRFCGASFYCARCAAELDAIYHAELARESAWENERMAEEQARWAAWEATPEGQAHRAEVERINEQTWRAQLGMYKQRDYSAVREDDDLPF